MKSSLFYNALLLGAAALYAGCSGSEDALVIESPPTQMQEWMARVFAANDSINVDTTGLGDASTRAIFIGGNDGNRFAKAWDSGDRVYVYKGNTYVGYLDPREADWGYAAATLEGTLTGPFAVNDELTLYSLSRSMDLTGQTGSIQSMSMKAYRMTTTTVTAAADNILSLSSVSMSHRVGYARFFLVDENGGARLHPSQLVIHALSGSDIVLKTDEEGTPMETGDLVINASLYEGEYPAEPYVALYRDYDSPISYTLKATVGDDIYIGPLEGQNAITSLPGRGALMNYRRKLRKTTAVNTLTVTDITSKVFTGSAIVPDDAEIIVTDDETTLMQGTDYLFEITDNVNVGDATVTITGQADKLARAQTKYIGTATKTFQITKATPVIDISTATMTLVNNLTQNTGSRTVTRVFIDNNGNGTWDEGTDYDITALCTVTYASGDTGVATVGTSTGAVTAASLGTTTITVTVAEAANWTTQTATYTVNVEQEVNGGNTVNPWDNGGTDGGKIYVE